MKVMVGMSGGVDSSVTALLLKEQGYEVCGVTLRLWTEGNAEGRCCSLEDVEDARQVANKIGIPYYVLNYRDVFKECVVDNFIKEYLSGRTPNPCIMCNASIKFEKLLESALKMGFDAIATGHYARIVTGEGGRKLLYCGNSEKDQSYVLYALTQEQLRHTLMPLGDYTKDEVREIARANGLSNSQKPDSQEICFVPDGDYASLIERMTGIRGEGNFLDTAGNVIGRHKGIYRYTIGQRKGLGVSLGGGPTYVVGIDPVNNTVTLGKKEDCYFKGLITGELNFIPFDALEDERAAEVKIRYNAPRVGARIIPKGDKVEVVFSEPQRAVTPGQAVVFYEGDMVLGGGVIEKGF